MGSIFGGPKAPKVDKSNQDRLEAMQRQQQEELREKESEIEDAKSRRRKLYKGVRGSLISNSETGVTGTPSRDTMG